MKGIEKITQRIAEDAGKEGQEILNAAREEGRAMADRYRGEAQELMQVLTEKGKKDAELRKERRVGVAELEARKQKLSVKQELIAAAFDNAVKDLTALGGEEMTELLARLAAESSRSGSEQVILAPDVSGALGKNVVARANDLLKMQDKPAKLTLSSEKRALGGGVLLSDGDIEVNSSFEALIGSLKAEMSGEVAKILFSA